MKGLIKPKDMEIGVKLYQYSSPRILEYIVIGVNELKTKGHIERFYILECQSCADHDKCQVATKFDDCGYLVYSHMINGYENDDDEYFNKHGHYKNGQYYWHKNKNHLFFKTRKQAQIFILNKNIDYAKDMIAKAEQNIKSWQEEIEKSKTQIEILNP